MLKVEKCGLLGLAQRRKDAGYTQAEFAAALGVERSTYANWEAGYVWPSAAYLPKMADLCCCTVDDLYKPPETIVDQEGQENHAV